jgi:hypothetical protein
MREQLHPNRMILVFAENYEQACMHFAGSFKYKWKYVQSIEDVRGYKDAEILDLGGWQADVKKIEAWDVVQYLRLDIN